eukprot:12201600-Alexandrium_andersonii.AAC.1
MQDSVPPAGLAPSGPPAAGAGMAAVVPSFEPPAPTYSAMVAPGGSAGALQLAEAGPNMVLTMMLQQQQAEQQDRAQLTLAVQTALSEFRSMGEAVRAGQTHMSLLTAE